MRMMDTTVLAAALTALLAFGGTQASGFNGINGGMFFRSLLVTQ